MPAGSPLHLVQGQERWGQSVPGWLQPSMIDEMTVLCEKACDRGFIDQIPTCAAKAVSYDPGGLEAACTKPFRDHPRGGYPEDASDVFPSKAGVLATDALLACHLHDRAYRSPDACGEGLIADAAVIGLQQGQLLL
jgi:hypothetical protein